MNKTDISTIHQFDGYTETELQDCELFCQKLTKTTGIEYKIEIETDSVFSITLNPSNKLVANDDFIEMEDELFSNISEELLYD